MASEEEKFSFCSCCLTKGMFKGTFIKHKVKRSVKWSGSKQHNEFEKTQRNFREQIEGNDKEQRRYFGRRTRINDAVGGGYDGGYDCGLTETDIQRTHCSR